jgi:hypothetical protein
VSRLIPLGGSRACAALFEVWRAPVEGPRIDALGRAGFHVCTYVGHFHAVRQAAAVGGLSALPLVGDRCKEALGVYIGPKGLIDPTEVLIDDAQGQMDITEAVVLGGLVGPLECLFRLRRGVRPS